MTLFSDWSRVNPPKRNTDNLKDNAVFLLKNEEQYFNDQHIEKNKVDRKYEKLSLNVRHVAVWL